MVSGACARSLIRVAAVLLLPIVPAASQNTNGELPPREAQLAPWQEIAVNLIGPWKIRVNNQLLTFHALSIMDTVTNLPELVRISSKSAAHVGLQLENTWLSRYPRPQDIIFEQGPEFLGLGF